MVRIPIEDFIDAYWILDYVKEHHPQYNSWDDVISKIRDKYHISTVNRSQYVKFRHRKMLLHEMYRFYEVLGLKLDLVLRVPDHYSKNELMLEEFINSYATDLFDRLYLYRAIKKKSVRKLTEKIPYTYVYLTRLLHQPLDGEERDFKTRNRIPVIEVEDLLKRTLNLKIDFFVEGPEEYFNSGLTNFLNREIVTKEREKFQELQMALSKENDEKLLTKSNN